MLPDVLATANTMVSVPLTVKLVGVTVQVVARAAMVQLPSLVLVPPVDLYSVTV